MNIREIFKKGKKKKHFTMPHEDARLQEELTKCESCNHVMRKEELASTLQVAFDAGAKRVLIPMSSAADIPTVPAELFAKFQISFYSSPEDAVIKALGIE